MYFTGAKFQSNDLKGTGDIIIFVLLCKIIHSFMHANMQIIQQLCTQWHNLLFLDS